MFSLQKVLRSPTISKITFRPLSNLPHFSISEEVQHALNNNLPLVALESTIITHGMPYPKNVECALGVEEQIRQKGALPATVAILDGKIRVGLTEAEVMKLGELRDEVVKTSRRDIAYVVANKLNGGTTVSGTLLVCNKVGIPIFATGGIGGVHRLGEQTLDISADLTELGKSGVAVFSSGAKSILDIPKTLEYLETQGVFVATYGDTTEFPAFYCRKSGHRVPYRIQSPVDAAKIILANRSCSLHSGMLFGVPVPKENALDEKEIDEIIRKALILANKEDVTGKNVTPFLLARVSEATKGRSLATTLVKNNAKIAAEVAVELSRIKKDNGRVMGAFGAKKESGKKQPVVIGGSVLDRCIRILDSDITCHLENDNGYSQLSHKFSNALCFQLRMPKIFERGVDDAQKDQILLLHNQHRDMIMHGTVPKQPKGKNIAVLTWDDALGKQAQNIADSCEYAHKPVKDDRFSVGQNLYQSMSSNQSAGPDWNKAVNAWYMEHENYTYGTKYPPNVGHYTQLVWGTTNCVGCGWVHFEGKNPKMKFQKFYVCNYGPAGNIIGRAPYEKAG